MSAFVVETETINRVCRLLDHLNGGRSDCEQLDHIGRQMLKLNYEAVHERYRHSPHIDSSVPPDDEIAVEFSYRHVHAQPVEMFAAAECWLYQCAEGDQFTSSSIYRRVQDARASIAHEILCRLPGYSWC